MTADLLYWSAAMALAVGGSVFVVAVLAWFVRAWRWVTQRDRQPGDERNEPWLAPERRRWR